MARLFPLALSSCLAAITLWPGTSLADTMLRPAALVRSLWRHEWPTSSPSERIPTVAIAPNGGVRFRLRPPRDPRWEGVLLHDKYARSELRLRSPNPPQATRAWADARYYAAPLLPLPVEPLIAAWRTRAGSEAAVESELMSLRALSYSGPFYRASTRLFVRENPDTSDSRDTESIETVALAVGVTRPASDRQDTSNAPAAGLGTGLGIGYAVPPLLRYSDEQTNLSVSIIPGGPCTGACLKVAGSF